MISNNILDANIHGTMMFRLLFRTQDDRYEPETAASAIGAFIDLDDEVCRLTIKLAAMDAERRLTRN